MPFLIGEHVDFYRALAEAINEGCLITRPDGNIVTCNRHFIKLTQSSEDVTNIHWHHFFPAAEHSALDLLAEEARAGKSKEEFTLESNGLRIPVEVTISPLKVDDEECFLILLTDLNERKKQAYALRESEHRFRLLMDEAKDYAIIMLDTSGRVTHWNLGAQRLYGYLASEILGHSFTTFYLPENLIGNEPQRALEQAVEVGRYEAEGWRVRKDGSRFWANVIITSLRDTSGTVLGYSKLVRDMTERNALELQLKESELFVRHTLDSLSAHVCVLDKSGKIIATNRNWRRFAAENNAPTDFQGANYLEVCDNAVGPGSEDAAAFAAGLRAVMNGELKTFRLEYTCHSPEEKRWFNARVAPFSDHPSAGFVIAHEIITEAKEASELQAGQNRILEKVASHAPLKNILTSLASFIEEQSPGLLCTILLLDKDGCHLRHGAAPSLPASFVHSINGRGIGPTAGSCGTSAFLGQTVVVTDIQTDPLWADYRDVAAPFGLRACWSTPIKSHQDKVLGTFAMYYREPRSPSPAELNLAQIATYLARIAIEHQLIEDTLHETEQKLRLFIQAAPVAIAMFDRQMHYMAASARWLTFHGLNGDVIGISHYVVCPKTPERWKQAHQRALSGTVERCSDDVFIHPDGTMTSFLWEVSPWTTSMGEIGGIVIYLEDMTQQKQTEEALRQTKERFETALNHSAIMVYNQDLDLRYTWMHNPPFGYPPSSEIIGKRAQDILDRAEDAAAVDALKREVLTSGTGVRREMLIHYKNAPRYYDMTVQPSRNAQGDLVGLVCVAMEVTERHQAEDRLRESELRFRALFEGAGDAIFIADQQGNYVDVNSRGTELLGYSRQEVLGLTIPDVVSEQDRSRIEPELNILRSGQSRISEWQFIRKDGSTFTGEVSGQLLPDGRFMGIARDVTARNEAAAALLKAKDEADRANKELEQKVHERTFKLQETVAELEQYSYSITHDLRAPLRAIQGFARMLEEENAGRLLPTSQGYLGHITASAERMEDLIRDSLNYGKILLGEIPLEPLDVAVLVQGIIQSYPVLQSPQAEIKIEGDLPPVLGNTAALSQCVSNILRNAVKFVPPGVTPRLRIWAQTSNGTVRLWFEDNGIGIPREAQERIFGMFQQLDKRYEGTGVGLAIVRKAVERMGGKVGVESEPGQGSRFWLDLKQPGEENMHHA